MLRGTEKKILEIMSKQLLVSKPELAVALKSDGCDGVDSGIGKLREMGYIEKVESLGTCFVLTQKGQRAVKGD
jgi:hypothetical protein